MAHRHLPRALDVTEIVCVRWAFIHNGDRDIATAGTPTVVNTAHLRITRDARCRGWRPDASQPAGCGVRIGRFQPSGPQARPTKSVMTHFQAVGKAA
jgi:hypothetical protein